MPEAKYHRTWPCGFQESIELKGWGVDVKLANDPQPCPLHGKDCSRKAGRTPAP
jgi:hypothetical protein